MVRHRRATRSVCEGNHRPVLFPGSDRIRPPGIRAREVTMSIVLSNLSPLLAGLWMTLSIAVLSFLGALVIGVLEP